MATEFVQIDSIKDVIEDLLEASTSADAYVRALLLDFAVRLVRFTPPERLSVPMAVGKQFFNLLDLDAEQEVELPPQHVPVLEEPQKATGGPEPGSNGSFHCPECARSFTTAQGLGAHRFRAHGVKGTSPASQQKRRARER